MDTDYRSLLMQLADEADADPQNGRGWDRESQINLSKGTYQDWVGYPTFPQPIQGLTPEVVALILKDICDTNQLNLESLGPEVTFGYQQCIYTGTEPMWRGGWEFRAGTLVLKWDLGGEGATVKGQALRALARSATWPVHGRAWRGSLRALIERG